MRTSTMAMLAVLLLPAFAAAQVYVNPYTRSDGTSVGGYQRTRPDGNPYNNYSYPGNFNPNTGQTTPGNPFGQHNSLMLPPLPQNPFGQQDNSLMPALPRPSQHRPSLSDYLENRR